MREARRDRTVHLGQFRLTRLQVVNWGTFCGYKDFAIDERGVLLTGPSGSGKSALMDAHSAALLPSHDQKFNASADLSVRGAKQGTRSIADYVRGAWSENDDEHEQSQVQYLRAGKPAWSAVAATYDNGLGEVTTAVMVRWFTGVENDTSALKPLYRLSDGHFDLTTLNEWAERRFDTGWFKRTYPATYPPSQTAYVDELAKRVGLGASASARSLLGKAKALKNVGDLNFFIRTNMLDEPETFTAAQKMRDAFTPLNEAYELAYRAHRQAQTLQDLPANWAIYEQAGHTRGRAERLMGAPTEHYLRGVHLRVLDAEMDHLENTVTQLQTLLEEQNRKHEELYERYVSLDRQLREESQVLQDLQTQAGAKQQEAAARERAYRVYSGYVTRLERACPQDEAAFSELAEAIGQIRQQAQSERDDIKPQRHEALAAAADATKEHNTKAAELIALQSAKTLIPHHAATRRERIASGADVPVAALPYAAELIDIASGQERWRPAAERVLRNYGMRLLVPETHQDAVRGFIDAHNMRGLIEYSIVTATSAHQPSPRPNTLASKLTVDTDHSCGAWLAGQVARKFDHVCVEDASDLEDHRVAVSVGGTVKLPGQHYRKDDRPELTNPASHILGANTQTKRAALQAEVDQLAEQKEQADSEAEQLDIRYRNLESIIEATTQLATFDRWNELDHWASTRSVNELQDRIDQIKADNVDLQSLECQRDKAEKAARSAADECANTRNEINKASERQTALADAHFHERNKPHSVGDDDDRAYLDEVYASVGAETTLDTMSHVRVIFRRQLEKRRDDADSERRDAFNKAEVAINRFVEEWRDTAPDTSGDIERCGGDFVVLHEEIVQRRLPEAMSRFQRMITEDMVPSIGMLQRAIEKAASEIQARIKMVNKGLERVEFDQGTHLQIGYKHNQSDDAREFRRAVDTLLRHAPEAKRDPNKSVAQFHRVRELMARFTADDTAARHWQTNVLDVRHGYAFYGREVDADGVTVHTYRNTSSNSGGEQEKLVAFCLAAALSYNLADPESGGRPRFASLMLDEAFSKSDETFSAQALAAFDEFGFQLLIAAPIRMSGIVEPFIGQAILVDKRMTGQGAHSHAASATFGELAARRVAESDGAVRASA